MGFLRGIGKFLGSTIFTTFLVFAVLMMEMTSFTSHDNFKTLVSGLLENQFSAISESDLATLQSLLSFQCLQAESVKVPLSEGPPVTLKCSDIKNSDKSQLLDLITASLADSLYYKEFDCSFIDCITQGNQQNLLVVATNEGNQFYRNLQMYMWIGTGAGLALLLVSVGTWAGRLKGVGFNLLFIGLPFLLLGYVQSSLTSYLPVGLESSVKPVIDSLLSSIKNKFIIISVVGAVSLVGGYALAFYLSRRVKKK